MTDSQTTELLSFLRRITTAAATAALYQLQHKQVGHLCQLAKEHLQQIFTERAEFTLMLIEDRLIFDKMPLEEDFSVARLIKFFQLNRIAHLTIAKDVTDQELLELIDLLSRKAATRKPFENSENISFGQVELAHADTELTDSLLQQFPSLESIQEKELSRFTEIYEAVQSGERLHVRGLNEIVGSFVQAFTDQGSSLMALAPLRDLDEYTYTHSTNVCILNIAQAKMLGIDGQLLYDIGISAMLHDIGKLFIPTEILQKDGALTDEEWAMIQQHPQKGAEYLVNTPGVPRLAVVTAYEHHMRFDQSGYPKAAKNWPQHLCSQMTTISDFFDALRTHRSYRAGMDFTKIASIMLEEAGTTLHPLLARNFLKNIQQLDQQQLH